MANRKINDRKLLMLIDEGVSQSETARKLGVTKQAVSQRLRELRGRTTKIFVSKPTSAITAEPLEQPTGVITPKASNHLTGAIDHKIDTLQQLSKVNRHANEMLDLLIRWQSGDHEALRVLESQVKRVTHGEGDDAEEVVQVKMKELAPEKKTGI
jgi:DNA-binding transcriptional regulator GbsR (MarR family)